MKVKKGDKVYPFITGDDVIITKGINHPGKTVDDAFVEVDETLDKHQKEIDKLKSNLKYVYSYGGVGGKGSGGSGSGSTGTAALFISLGGHQLQNGGNPIVLNEPGNYVLEGNVSNSGGETYYVSVTVGNKEVPIPALSIEKNKCRFSTSVNLPRNGEISVMFYAPDGETVLASIHQNYIVNPHTFEVKFKYEFESGGITQEAEFDSSNEYFIGDTSHRNPFIDTFFKIDIPNVSNVSVKYSIGDTTNGQGTEQFDTTDISNNHFKIYLDELIRDGEKFTDESNTGTYTVSVTLNYTVNAETVTSTTSFRITLIPNYLYINVRNPQDLLYDTLDDLLDAIDNGVNGIPEKNLNVGVYTSFYCKIYEGAIRTSRKQYPLTFKSYDMYDDSDSDASEIFKDVPSIVENRTGIVEQVEMSRPISVAFETPGIKKLEFMTLGQKTTVHDNEKPVVKYIYVKESEVNIDWYPTSLQQQTFYFRANSGENTFSPEFPTSAFSGTSPLELSETSRPITLSNEIWAYPDTGSRYDSTIISFGMQYSTVNKDGAEILRTYEGNSNVPDIVLCSNKLFSDIGKKICIPTESNFDKSINEQYHLVQIVRYKIGIDSSNHPQYASYLYIDGKLESNKPGTDSNQLFIGRIVLNNVNVIYNHIGIQYVKLDEPSVAAANKTNTIDSIIYQYYLAYKNIMHVGEVTEAEREILKSISDIKFDGENVIVDKSFIDSTSPYMPIPTMMMEYEGQKLDDGTPDMADLNKFISDLFRGYPNGDTAFGRREISLYWCEGKKEGTKTTLNKVEVPAITDSKTNIVYTGNWMVELQGTSTMRNKIKNFSLVVNTKNDGGDKILLMSPNYDKNNPKTFLPESVWTIKADIADSAHANNTSIGKFVNEVCTPFGKSNGMNLTENVAAYVKNTLEGFPVLMYFKIGEAVYYLGVYNFNMGRQSYYNLGYHTSDDMTDMISNIVGSGDVPFSFSIGSGEIVSTLAIGEIQDNFAEFDFHQYDDSVLFQPDDSSITRMFGKDEKITGANKGNAKVTLSNFVKSVSRAGAYCFASIGKKPVKSKADDSDKCINRYDIESYKDEENKTHFIEKVPDISWQMKYSGTDRIWSQDTTMTFDKIGKDIDNLLKCIYTETSDNPNNVPFLDFSSVSEYYTICMAFGMVDSILKNMNIKSWDGHKCYIAFYDMDCALEENNAGGEDVSYLAATDYWHSDFSRGYVEPVTVNYDYWDPKIGKGFDFSSSYLFAIAKYAQAIFNKLDENKITLSNFPQQFWAKLRQPKTETSNGGALQDANYFINNYFSSGIGKIPAYLASLNYQVKYLYKGTIIDDEGKETEVKPLANENAFNGTRLEKVKDWLNKRLHFLDVVFNVQGIGLPIGGGYTTPSAETTLLSELRQNNDIVVLSDMFSTENSKTIIMGSNSLPVDVYAPMNTPFIINRGSSNEIYLLCAGTDKPNPINITATQSESYRFLGSKEFTNLSMVEPFLTSAYMINSNKIEEIIYGGLNVPPVTGGFNIVSTSVKKILFNIPTFGGTLTINSTGLYGQALHTLDISRTGFSCDLRNLRNLSTLNIASINATSISVAECPIVGENCTISAIEGYNPTTLNSLTMSGVSGKFDIRDTNIENITFTIDPDKTGEISINGDQALRNLTLNGFSKISVRNCPNLEKLIIENPEKCTELIIDIPEANERQYTLDGFNNTYKKYNSETGKEEDVTYPGVFDFTSFINLETLSLSGSEAEVIKIPNKLVSIITFRDNKKLEFIDTAEENSVIELTQDSTFFNCLCYGMRQSWWSKDRSELQGPKYPISNLIGNGQKGVGNLTKMCVSETCESLANTFYKSTTAFQTKYTESKPYTNIWGQDVYNKAIDNVDATEFIDRYVCGKYIEEEHIIEVEKNIYDIEGKRKRYGKDRSGNIKSLYGCFYNQKGIRYTGSPDASIPNLSDYTNLTNISMMYYGTDVTRINSALLSLPEENNNNDGEELLMENILGRNDVSISKDAFKNVSYRLTNLSNMALSIYGNGSDYLTLQNTDFKVDGYLNIIDILCPKLKEGKTDAQSIDDYEPFTRITSFENFYVNPSQWIDYSDLMKICPNVTYLSNFLSSDLSKSKIDGMLKCCKNLTSIDSSFNHSGNVENLKPIDLYDFFNWGDPENPNESLFNKITNLFTSNASSGMSTVGFSVNKKISNDHFLEIMGLLHNYQGIQKLSNIFSYCTIEGYSGSEIKLDGDMDNVRNISSLFYKCKSKDGRPLNIKRSFFEHLKNVTIMTNTFNSVYFDHMLSYDFFCKQIPEAETPTETVYLNSDGSSEATLKTVKYNTNLINDMSDCFYNAKFVKCDNWFDPEDKVNIGLIPFTDIVNDDSNITEYYKYEGGKYVKYTISENTALLDTKNNFTHYVNAVRISALQDSTSQNSSWHFNNHDIDKDLSFFNNRYDHANGPYLENSYNIYPTYCCLPPDIFYGCNLDCNLTNVFANTNIIGVIPQHLLKKCTSSKLNNMFQNVNILPNLIYHYDGRIANFTPGDVDAEAKYNDYIHLISGIDIDEGTISIPSSADDKIVCVFEPGDALVLFRNANGELRKRRPISYVYSEDDLEHTPITNDNRYKDFNKSQFVYVPQGYTTNQNLNNAFTFRYNLPPQIDLETSALASEGITWPYSENGMYDTGCSPEIRPDLWPYHIQYFFTSEESISWNRLIYMSSPFISDSQDVDFETGKERVFSSIDPNYKNRWWSNNELVVSERWHNQTDGLLNVFLNLCGKRDVRTGKISDNGCAISKSMTNIPQIGSFITGILVTFLNGKVFDDGLDAGRLTNLNASSNIIQYTNNLGRNIILPKIQYHLPDISKHPKIVLLFNAETALFYKYMFDVNSFDNYKNIFNFKTDVYHYKDTTFKYKVR